MIMSQFYTPILLITEYYDTLIREIDIYTEELLERHSPDAIVPSKLNSYIISKRETKPLVETHGIDSYIDPYTSNYKYDRETLSRRNENYHMRDYLNMEREMAIDGIKKAQQCNLDWYKANKCKLKFDKNKINEETIEELKSQLFADAYCFLLKIGEFSIDEFEIESVANNYHLYIISTDFYLSENNIEYLRKSFNGVSYGSQPDEKRLLSSQIKEYINGLWRFHKYGLELVHIDQRTLLNISKINYNPLSDVCLSHPSTIDLLAVKSLNVDHIESNNVKLIDLSALSNLEYLDVKNMVLNSHNPFQNLNMLKKLTIERCNLCEFDFRYLSSLEILLLTDCSSLEINWNCFINIKWLSLSSIKEFKMTTASLYDLTILELYDCQIEPQKADAYFKDLELPSLIYLDMSGNDLPEIKECWFAGMENLRTLKLKSVKLKSLNFVRSTNFPNLQSLDVSLNQIMGLENGIFLGLDRLNKLNLNYNHVSDITPRVFDGLNRLEILKMKNIGSIENIDKDVFYGLKELIELDLSYNGLNGIHREAFVNVPNLISLDLSGNNLILDKDSFFPLMKLKSLSINYNLCDISSDVLEYLLKLQINFDYN